MGQFLSIVISAKRQREPGSESPCPGWWDIEPSGFSDPG